MYAGAGVKTSQDYPIPDIMKAWVLGNPGELKLAQKPVPVPKRAEVLVRIDAVAICATDLEIIDHGPPASIQGGMPFNKNFTPGHEYMGTVVALGPGVDEYRIGQRITVEIHAGCGQCKRCREGMYTACHNYGLNYGDVDKGHRANGFTTDGGFCEYQVNHINTLVAIPDAMSDEEATLVVTAGTAMYGLTELGGLVAGESVVVTGPGPIGLLGVAVAKALGASPVILTGTRDNRLTIGSELGADHVVNVRNENAVEAVRQGAFDYLTKPFVPEELRGKVSRALSERRWTRDRTLLKAVGEATNAAEGLRLFEALRPQLVTLDLVMPDIDGMTAMDLFRRISQEDADTSVLIISVRPLGDSHDFLKMGAIGYLEKPFIDFEQAGKLLRDCFPELEPKVPLRKRRGLSKRLAHKPDLS